MLSFASCTSGWSNGLIASAQPATAVANSAKKKIRPRSPAPAAVSVTVGCPAAANAATASAWRGSGASASRRCTNTRSGPYAPASTSGSSAIGRIPRPCLPVDSATSCSAQSPNAVSGGSTTNVSLSRPRLASSPSAAPSHSPELPACSWQFSAATWPPSSTVRDVDAGQRRRHDAERRERRVPAADLGVAGEHVAEALALGQLLQRRARVGDGHEVRGVGLEAAEVGQQRVRLERPARLGGDDEQRRRRVDEVGDRLDLERLGRVEHVQPQRAGRGRVGAAEDLGGEARPAHAEQDRVRQPVRAHAGDERLDRRQVLEQLVGDRQPAEPVLELGCPGRRPQRAVLAPHAARDVLLGGRVHAVGDGLLEVGRQGGLERRGAVGDDRLALGLDPGDQLVHRDDERLDPVAQQLRGHVVEVDAGGGERLEVGRGVLQRPVAPVTSPAPAAACSVGSGIVFTVSGATSP